ncbi:MAG: CPBP family intramembrane metalloprotease [Coriobacteriia bacterium]|nr:CPBP family intramembrane metalloprotease [Coriobacteriia bacterium]
MTLAITLVVQFAAAAALLFALPALARRRPAKPGRNSYIASQIVYQPASLVVAAAVLGVSWLLNPENFARYFSVGTIGAPATPVAWLGIGPSDTWATLGLSFAVTITVVTSIFLFFRFRGTGVRLAELAPLLGWVLLFALTNSFAEEAIFRLGIIVPLVGVVATPWVLLISAVIFGAPHYRGMPNGIIGALLAGFLGWLLAGSVIDTGGIFWAWTIHFLQDVVIISALALSAAHSEE